MSWLAEREGFEPSVLLEQATEIAEWFQLIGAAKFVCLTYYSLDFCPDWSGTVVETAHVKRSPRCSALAQDCRGFRWCKATYWTWPNTEHHLMPSPRGGQR